MKVRELIKKLKEFDQDANVKIETYDTNSMTEIIEDIENIETENSEVIIFSEPTA